MTDHPVSHVQWVPRELLRANDYNPNRAAPPELELLRLSILEDGWTQPIVVRPDGDHWEIVDGFHRWMVAADAAVAAMSGGRVPIVELTRDPSGQRLSTIRHNRARGTHQVVPMAEIVEQLVADGMTEREVQTRLGMEREEVRRLLDRGNMLRRGSAAELSKAWRPAELDE